MSVAATRVHPAQISPSPPHQFHRIQQEKEDGEAAASRPLGGFERFFATFQSLGLGLIYFIADVEGPVNADVSAC